MIWLFLNFVNILKFHYKKRAFRLNKSKILHNYTFYAKLCCLFFFFMILCTAQAFYQIGKKAIVLSLQKQFCEVMNYEYI